MDEFDFVLALEAAWHKKLDPEQAHIYRTKVLRFSPQERELIHGRLLQDSKYFPKIAEIYEAARELGFFRKTPQPSPSSHAWQPTPCPLCKGEGRLAAMIRPDRNSKLESRALAVFPYSSDEACFYPLGPQGCFSVLFRCSCPAGEAETLPKSWPRWKELWQRPA